MLLSLADVSNIQDKFVKEMLMFLKRRKYMLEPNQAKVYPYYADSILVEDLVDCLTYEQICELKNKASNYIFIPLEDTEIISCNDSLAIDLTAKATTCTYESVLSNPVDGSNFPRFTLTPNETNHSATINVITTGCSETITNTAETGCVLAGNCDDTLWNVQFAAYVSLPQAKNYPNGFITSLRVFEVDASGVPTNIATDLNISPSNVSSWTSCGTCNPVNAAHLVFGHSNFRTAFNTLMDNVSKTLYGADYTMFDIAAQNSWTTDINVWSIIKHNPTGRWITMNPHNSRVVFDNGSGQLTVVNAIQTTSIAGAMYEEVTASVSCGDIDLVVSSNNSVFSSQFPTIDQAATQYNSVVLQNANSINPVTLTGDTTFSCSYTTLTASYDSTDVVSKEWRDPSDAQVSTEDSVIVTTSGIYSFKATTTNGCIITKTITVA